jgi:oligopeptide/dipeptide ABC transporter ATP-binding protein
MTETFLEVKGLTTRFFTDDGVVTAVDDLDFRLEKGETLGIVGESGCGKSVTALSILRLIPNPPGRITAGQVLFEGDDILGKEESEMRRIRGNTISMIFQEPMTSLNPVYTVGDQIAEAIALHQGKSRAAAWAKAVDMLRLVGIPLPERRAGEYSHQLSGGMRQRVMIAMALSCNPRLLIADEPTTALDVTIQAQILDLMSRLKREMGMSIMLITHDLGVIAEMAERVLVMYAGRIVEGAPVEDLFADPLHPYTSGLLKSIPRLDTEEKTRLHVIEGTVPNLARLPRGCAFSPRCPRPTPQCLEAVPPLVDAGGGRVIRCWLVDGVARRGAA